MAHYAADCWDAEVETSYGWIECVGLADRSAFDLDAHSKAAGVDLTAFHKFDKPIEMDVIKVPPLCPPAPHAHRGFGSAPPAAACYTARPPPIASDGWRMCCPQCES
eukprot:2741036-Pyramimonas_sp.AAC.3